MNKPYFTRPKDNKLFPTEQYWTRYNAEKEAFKQGKRFLTVEESLFIKRNATWDCIKKGIRVAFPSASNKNKKINIFFPASGYRVADSGAFYTVGSTGNYWGDAINGDHGHCLYLSNTEVNMSYHNGKAYWFSVRCVSDTKCPGSRQAHVMINDKPVWIDLHNLKYKKI